MSAKRALVVVLGMHRSGTSALAGTLHHLGVDLGASLMPAAEEVNSKGFFENEQIVQIHERLLFELGYSWHDVRLFPKDWLSREFVQSAKNQIIQIFHQEFGEGAVWGIKDPRICRLLPLWKEIFTELGVKVFYIHIFRNPLEVAMSLGRRDSFLQPDSLLLWFLHNVEAISATRDQKRSFIEYAKLIQDWRGCTERLGRELEISWPLSARQAGAVIDEFLTPTLYHHRCNAESLGEDPDVNDSIRVLYALLQNAAANGADIALSVESFARQYRNAFKLLSPWQLNSEKMLSAQEKQSEILSAQLIEARNLVEQRDQCISFLEPAIEDAQRIVKLQKDKLEDSERRLNQSKQLAAQHMARIELLEAGLRDAQRWVDERNKTIDLHERALHEAQQIVDQKNEKIDLLEKGLERAEQLAYQRLDQIEQLDAAYQEAYRSAQLQSEKLKNLESALAESEKLDLQRAARVNELQAALNHAQEIVHQQNGDLQSLARGLEGSERLAIQRLDHIHVLDAALKDAQQWVRKRTEYIARLEPALEEAQSIVRQQNERIEQLNAELKFMHSMVAELQGDRISCEAGGVATEIMRRAENR